MLFSLSLLCLIIIYIIIIIKNEKMDLCIG